MSGEAAPRLFTSGPSDWLRACSRPDRVAIALIVAVTIATAVQAVLAYWPDADLLWRGVHHDRNAHFQFGLDLAVAVRSADPVAFASTLSRSTVWPPVHGLALAAVLLVGGIDHRLGIVPSLLGWSLTVVFAALLARRLAALPANGKIDKTNPVDSAPALLAAAVAAAFTLASPAFRLLATDVMLEALGAGLSAWALWAFARAMEAPGDRRRWRALALVLTALFFEKGNYWGLVVAALLVAAVGAEARRVFDGVRAAVAALELGPLLRSLWRDPLVLSAALLMVLIAVLYARGPSALVVFGRTLNLYPPENLTTAAYALVFWRAALVWRRHRTAADRAVGTAGRMLLTWHVLPVAVSFLVPKRLSAFIWFVGPANRHADQAYDLAASLAGNWAAFADGFHPAPWLAVLALSLFVLGLTQARRSAGHRAVFALALIASLAVVIHPQQQGRFLASWIFAYWIGAGIGAAALLRWLTARLVPAARVAVAAALGIAGVVFAAVPSQPTAAARAVAIRAGSGPSDLDLLRPVFSALDGTEGVGVAATFGRSAFFTWALRERCRCRREIDAPWMSGLGARQEVRRVMADYLAGTAAASLLIVDAPGTPYAAPEPGGDYAIAAGLIDALSAQTRFARVATAAVPAHGATVSVWRRSDSADTPASAEGR